MLGSFYDRYVFDNKELLLVKVLKYSKCFLINDIQHKCTIKATNVKRKRQYRNFPCNESSISLTLYGKLEYKIFLDPITMQLGEFILYSVFRLTINVNQMYCVLLNEQVTQKIPEINSILRNVKSNKVNGDVN